MIRKMKGLDHEPEYRRRIREKAEKYEREADEEDRETQKRSDNQKIVATLGKINEQQKAYANQSATENDRVNRREWWRFWVDVLGVGGLWSAAAVGTIAIIIGTRDSKDQREIMQ